MGAFRGISKQIYKELFPVLVCFTWILQFQGPGPGPLGSDAETSQKVCLCADYKLFGPSELPAALRNLPQKMFF